MIRVFSLDASLSSPLDARLSSRGSSIVTAGRSITLWLVPLHRRGAAARVLPYYPIWQLWCHLRQVGTTVFVILLWANEETSAHSSDESSGIKRMNKQFGVLKRWKWFSEGSNTLMLQPSLTTSPPPSKRNQAWHRANSSSHEWHKGVLSLPSGSPVPIKMDVKCHQSPSQSSCKAAVFVSARQTRKFKTMERHRTIFTTRFCFQKVPTN